MATEPLLRIGYAGSLKAHRPGQEQAGRWHWLTDWFWTYRNRNLHHHTRSGHYLLKGLAACRQRHPEIAAQIRLEWWGLIDADNARQAEEMGIAELVQIEGYLPRAASRAKLDACDVLFLPLETADDPLFIPGKLYDYLQLGKPVLVLGPESDCTRILDRAGCGWRIDPEDTEAVAEALREMVEFRAELPRRFTTDMDYVESHFHFRNLAKKLDGIFRDE